MAEKSFPSRRTHCGTKGRWSFDQIKGSEGDAWRRRWMIWTRSPWTPSGVLRDALPDVPRPILSQDEPPLVPVDERPVPRNRKISQDAGCAKCRKLSRNEYSHPGLAHAWDCRTRIDAASRADAVYRDSTERAEQRKMDFYAKDVERIDHPRRASLEPSIVPEQSTEVKEGEDQPIARDTKRARWEPEQDLSGEIPVPSAEETLTTAEIPAAPSGVIPSSSNSTPISPGASSSSGVNRTYSGSTALPNSLGVPPGKRAHGDSMKRSNPGHGPRFQL